MTGLLAARLGRLRRKNRRALAAISQHLTAAAGIPGAAHVVARVDFYACGCTVITEATHRHPMPCPAHEGFSPADERLLGDIGIDLP